MSKVIKQPDKVSCVACVACMATGTTLSAFKSFIKPKLPPYSDVDCARYLLEHGLVMGVGFSNKDGGKLYPENVLRLDMPLRALPAYVVVKSKRFPGMPHAVYWDGDQILDSNPKIEGDGLPLNAYEVLYWMPICDMKGGFELDIDALMKRAK